MIGGAASIACARATGGGAQRFAGAGEGERAGSGGIVCDLGGGYCGHACCCGGGATGAGGASGACGATGASGATGATGASGGG